MIVLDSSAIVKLVLNERGSYEVMNIVKKAVTEGEEIITIDIALSEVLNALWKHHVLLKDIDERSFKESVRDLLRIWKYMKKVNTSEVALKAIEIAENYRITVYDALYLSVALLKGAKILTFDERQTEIARKVGITTYS